MPQKIRLATALRSFTNNLDTVEVQAGNVGEALSALVRAYPGMADRLVDENGSVRRFVNIYVNEEDIRFLQDRETRLKDGDEISIIPAIAGG